MDEKIECPECEGAGIVSVFQECGRVASMCCGSCFETIVCEECNGEGEVYE